jgi:hypothetical protein
MYGCGRIADRLETDEALRRQVLAVRERLFNQAHLPL